MVGRGEAMGPVLDWIGFCLNPYALVFYRFLCQGELGLEL